MCCKRDFFIFIDCQVVGSLDFMWSFCIFLEAVKHHILGNRYRTIEHWLWYTSSASVCCNALCVQVRGEQPVSGMESSVASLSMT